MEVELPPDVVDSETETTLPLPGPLDVEGSDCESVELPPDVDASDSDPGGLTRCNCKLRCHKTKKFDSNAFRADQIALSQREHASSVFATVRRHVVLENGDTVKRTQWTVQGDPVCRAFFEWCHAVGHATLDRYCKFAREGATELPDEKLPRMPRVDQLRTASIRADAWFLNLYRTLAEPQAIEDDALVDECGSSEVLTDTAHPLWATSVNLPDSDKRCIPVLYLNPGCFEDLFLQYEASTEPVDRVSKSTLYKVWIRNWSRVMRFRNVGQGKRCKVCAKLDHERSQAVTEEERASIGKQKQEHINEVLADRGVTGRTINIAEADAANPNEDGHDQLLAITIDGMDQAKFKVPRNLASSAEFEALWRPPLHVTGVIVAGHIEAYFISDTDMAKDSNMNATVISRVLDIIHEKLPGMPRNLAVQADNTTRESKNQYFLQFLSYLVASGKFDVSELQFLQVGHTHNEQDQRFSSVATSLSRAPTLEDPEEFAAWIRNHVKPARGREMHVEVLTGTRNFQSWMDGFGVQIQGLAATHAEPNTTHCWRICRRSLLPEVGPVLETWDGSSNAADAVFMAKELLHHKQLSQQPLVLLPHVVAMGLDQQLLTVKPCNQLGDRVLKEYRKTAIAVAKEPWRLFKAQHYLQELCRRNEAEELPVGVHLDFIHNYTMPSRRIDEVEPLMPLAEPRHHQVRNVVVRPKPVPKPAASKAAPKAPAAKSGPGVKKRPAAKRPAADMDPDSASELDVDAGDLEHNAWQAQADAAAPPEPGPGVPEPAPGPAPVAAPEERPYGCSKCRGAPGCTKSCRATKCRPWTKEDWDVCQAKMKAKAEEKKKAKPSKKPAAAAAAAAG
jgi:hypothetical protein